jgi:acyl-CoA thioester hydrolase
MTSPTLEQRRRETARVRIQRRVEWPDTDVTGHYHHSTVIRWVEAAEYVLYSRLGFPGTPLYPRVSYQADYKARLWHHDVVDIDLSVASVGQASLAYNFSVSYSDRRAVDGRFTIVQIDTVSGRSTPWGADLREALLSGGPQDPELLTGLVPQPRPPVALTPQPAARPCGDHWGIGYG